MAFTGSSTTDFYGLIQGAARALRGKKTTPTRRDPAPAVAARSAETPQLPERALTRLPDPVNRAQTAQDTRRAQIEAERMAGPFIKGLRAGDYAYRLLKDAFDRHCEQAGIDPVSDQRFSRWLQHHGGKKYRCNYPKTTMYTIPKRRAQARSAVGIDSEARC